MYIYTIQVAVSLRRSITVVDEPTGFPSSKYVVYATACAYKELYGKITDRKKNCVNNYVIS